LGHQLGRLPSWRAGGSPATKSCSPSLVATKKRAASGSAAGGTGSGEVIVPMQGTIVKVLVAVGDKVEVGQTICLLEAMKMENAINAERAGVIKEVRATAGDSVGAGDIVAVIE